MAISNLWEMAKADRYTADGREAIAKAREADVEDYTERGSGKQINIPTTKDSAPRQLTGDCKITIKG